MIDPGMAETGDMRLTGMICGSDPGAALRRPEVYIPAIVRARWEECVASPDIMRFESFCTLLDAFLFDLLDKEPDNPLTYALKGLHDEAKRRIKGLMPKEPA